MSIRADELETRFSLDGTTFSLLGGERAITTAARDMSVTRADLPSRWEERPVKVMDQPKFGQRDYAAAKFLMRDDEVEKAALTFETVVYSDQRTAAAVLMGTLSKMGFLQLSKVDVGDAGAMIEIQGRAGRTMKAIAFVERNVFGLVMLSCMPDCSASDSWLISMARLMASRMH
jgi:hypothetical protein